MTCGALATRPNLQGEFMISGAPAVTDHDGTAADVAAVAEALANAAVRPDELIQLSCQVSADGMVTVAIRGDLDVATVDRTVRYVTEVIDRCDGPVSADLSELAFCDACGLGALVRVNAYATQMGRTLELISPSPAVTKIMRLTHLDEWLLQPALAGVSGGVPRG
jgi:anti-anti-sigma factor